MWNFWSHDSTTPENCYCCNKILCRLQALARVWILLIHQILRREALSCCAKCAPVASRRKVGFEKSINHTPRKQILWTSNTLCERAKRDIRDEGTQMVRRHFSEPGWQAPSGPFTCVCLQSKLLITKRAFYLLFTAALPKRPWAIQRQYSRFLRMTNWSLLYLYTAFIFLSLLLMHPLYKMLLDWLSAMKIQKRLKGK